MSKNLPSVNNSGFYSNFIVRIYRPISLPSIFNRILEKLTYHRLKSYLGKNDILFKSQYDFPENHSTQHAIIDIVNVIHNSMDQKLFTCGIF